VIARLATARVRGVVAALLGALVLTVLALAVISQDSGAQSEPGGDYRINAIFDTAKGIIPGQVLKIAGARAGTVDDVTLTKDYKARIEMTTDQRFAPFRADASCSIRPEGLISERFVQCNPGTPDAPELGKQDGVPTVPVTRTTVPVAITDVFNVFNLPVRQRFTVLIASLGLGVSGRGDDFNDVLRRANPTLKLVRDVLQRLDRDKRDLQDAVASTDAVVAELAKTPKRAGDFIRAADKVVAQTATHSSALQRGIRTLPALLDEAEPSLAAFERFAGQGTPLLRDLRRSAPAAEALLDQIAPFSAKARPALRELGNASTTGIPVAKKAAPLVGLLKTFSGAALPTGTQLADLLVNARDRGVAENLLTFLYNATAFTARYDSKSHIGPTTVFFDPACGVFAQVPTAACDANYTRTQPTAVRDTSKGAERKRATKPTAKPLPSLPALPQVTKPAPAETKKPPSIDLPGLPQITVPDLPGLPQLGAGRDRAPSTDDNAIQGLLDYLLG